MECTLVVRVRDGLHARPATRFVKLAKSFQSDVQMLANGKAASAKSSVRLMLLSVKENDTITLVVSGSDEDAATASLKAFLEDPEAGLEASDHDGSSAHDDPTMSLSVDTPPSLPVNGLKGIGASEGLAIGPVYPFFHQAIPLPHSRLSMDEAEGEVGRFNAAIVKVQNSLRSSLSKPDMSVGDREIIEALAEAADDEMLRADTLAAIRAGTDAVSATHEVADRIAAMFAGMDDAYLSGRADDIRAIGRQICLALVGKTETSLSDIPAGAIIVAEDISALDLTSAHLEHVGGIVCGRGAATSHIAIIARTHAIPAVLGVGDAVQALTSVKELAIDGKTGAIISDPDGSVREDFAQRNEVARRERESLQAFKSYEPRRADGTIIEIAANIGSLDDIPAAKAAGAMGVGLFRTEFLFLQHKFLTNEDAQYRAYSETAKAFAPYPVIIRTLDVGGDKPVPGIQFPHEENPFLGWRGIRMCLDRPAIFKVQLRALLRAAVHGSIKIMIPMVSDITELRRTREMLTECAEELTKEGKPFGSCPLGVMIETPAAVLIAPDLAREAAFFSIGTNDLTQYIMAADRLNPTLSALNDVTNPAVMRAIALTAEAGMAAGIMVGICGEAAGRADLIHTFIRMGITELSMNATAILKVKKIILELT